MSNHVNSPRGAVQGLNFVWDIGTLQWVVETQPTGGGGVGGGGDGAILDGVNATIKATVTGAKALKVDGSAVTQPTSDTNIDVALSTRLKPADTLTKVATVDTITNVVHVDDNAASLTVDGTVAVSNFPATQPVSGTVTANAGSNLNTSALALDATLTGRTAKSQITDGTRDGTVKAGSTLPAATDTAVVVTQRDALPAGANVIGHVIADSGSTTAVTGNVTVIQGTAANLKVDLSGTSANATAIKVDNSAVTQPVSNAGLTNLDVALSTRLKPADTLTKVTTVDTITNPVAVTGTFFQATQPVSGTVAVSNFPATQPVSGTVTANQGGAPWSVTGSFSASTAADVQNADDDVGYADGDLAKNLVQTPDGRLRTTVAGKVSDARESYQDGQIRSLSITTDGRLRISSSPADTFMELFVIPGSMLFDIPDLTSEDDLWSLGSNSPWA